MRVHRIRIMRKHDLPSPNRCRDTHTNNSRRRSPVEGLDYGGPAVVEPRLLRPETLRRHLSVGLPFAKPKKLSDVSFARSHRTPIYVTHDYRTFGHNFTLHLASGAVQVAVVATVSWRTINFADMCGNRFRCRALPDTRSPSPRPASSAGKVSPRAEGRVIALPPGHYDRLRVRNSRNRT